MWKFEHYKASSSVEEAVSLLTEYGKEGKVIAGGTDVIPLMRTGALTPRCIIDITRVPGLDYVTYDKENGLRIGALATISTVERARDVNREYLCLYEAVHRMATAEVRNMATVAGNICRASPAADTAPPLLVLEATVKIAGPAGTRIVPLAEFFQGPGETVCKDNEIVTEVQVPPLPAGTGTAFLRASRTAVDLAQVNIAAVLTMKNGVCQDARIALGGVAPTPVRVEKAEGILRGKKIEDKIIEEAAQIATKECKPITDIRSTEECRRIVSEVLVKRVIKIAVERAK